MTAASGGILALDASCAGVVCDGRVRAVRLEAMVRGQASRLPVMAADVLAEAAFAVPGLAIGLVAVCVGPGSFTGLRAAIALAHGLAAGWGCPVVPAATAEVLRADVPAPCWVAIHSRTGRVFLMREEETLSLALDDLPEPPPGLHLVGNAAAAVAERLRGGIVLEDRALPAPQGIAAIGLLRHCGELPPLATLPLYVDPPEARPAFAQ